MISVRVHGKKQEWQHMDGGASKHKKDLKQRKCKKNFESVDRVLNMVFVYRFF
jgi:hypothetical protein